MIYEGGTSRAVFEIYVEKVLCPSLRPGDIVVLDNLSSHKSTRITEMITGCGAVLKYLPVYSPDLNPIEKMWSKMKSILRRIKARTTEELDAAIKTALDAVTPQDAEGWFLSCGYKS
jgi:transposase